MTTDRLARHSRLMATLTQILIVGMLVLNVACWFFPDIAIRYGLGFNLTAIGVTGDLNVDVSSMPGWQLAGGIILSSIPLLILAYGLNALRRLFKLYSDGQYFSEASSVLLGKVGFGVIMWVVLTFVLTPAISVWVTFLQPPGQGLLTIAFDSSHLVSLFLAASVTVIARIQQKGSVLARENQQFI